MRALHVVVAIICVACTVPTSSTAGTTSPCGTGTHLVGGVCEANASSATTIVIGPGLAFNTPEGVCFAFSPNPASVRVGQALVFQNNTTTSVTILGNPNGNTLGTPWITVGPGSTSGGLTFSAAGTNVFGVQACIQAASKRGAYIGAANGTLNVTIN